MKKLYILFTLLLLFSYSKLSGQCCTSTCSNNPIVSLDPVNPTTPINRCIGSPFAMTANLDYTFCYGFTSGAANFDDYMTVSIPTDADCPSLEVKNIEICRNSTSAVLVSGDPASTGPVTFNTTTLAVYSICVTVRSTVNCSFDGCITATPSTTPPSPPSPPCETTFATISGYKTLCSGETTALTAKGGSSFAWTVVPNSITITNPNDATIQVNEAGNYTVTVTNAGNCPSTATVTVVPINCCTQNSVYQLCQTHLDAEIGNDRSSYANNTSFQVNEAYLLNFEQPSTFPAPVGVNLVSASATVNLKSITNNTVAPCNFAGVFANINVDCNLTPPEICPVVGNLLTAADCGANGDYNGTTTAPASNTETTLTTCGGTAINAQSTIGIDLVPALFFTSANSCPATGISNELVALEYDVCITYTYAPTPIDITPTASICAGATIDLQENSLNPDATPTAWMSSNTNIASVDNTGVVTGIAAGTAIITYTDANECTATETITINDCCAGSIQFIKN